MRLIDRNPAPLLFAASLALLALPALCAQQLPVKVWEEKIVIPTYAIGAPEPNPIFNLGRNSQVPRHRLSLSFVRFPDAQKSR